MFFSVSSYFVLQHYNPPKTKIKKEILSSSHQFQKLTQDKSTRSIASTPSKNFYIKRIRKSARYNMPYLALTTKEIKENNLSDIVLQRAGRICQNLGYHSAVDFHFKSGSEKTKLAYFDDKYREQQMEVESEMAAWNIAFNTTLFLPSKKLEALKANLPEGDFLSSAAIISSKLGISYGLSHVFSKRIEKIKLESIYKKHYMYFSNIDCLGAKQGISDKKVAEFEVRRSCNVSYKNDSICNKASLKETSCLVDLSSKNNSKQLCKNLVAKIQNDKELQCNIAIFKHSYRSDYIQEFNPCAKIKDNRHLQCLVAAIDKHKLYHVKTDKPCNNIKSSRELQCRIAVINKLQLYNINQYKPCANARDNRELQCTAAAINKGYELSFLARRKPCANIKSDKELKCLLIAIKNLQLNPVVKNNLCKELI